MNIIHRSGLAAMTAIAIVLLAGCSASQVPGVYRIDVQQGNIVTEDMLKRLEPGMDRRKVRFILGTPLIADAFNADRWDYLYTYQTGTDDRVQRSISLFFKDDRLADVTGDIQAAWRREPPAPRNDKVIGVKGPRDDGSIFSALNPFDDEPTADDGPGLWSSITGGAGGKRVIRRVEDVRAEEAARAAAKTRAAEAAPSAVQTAASGSAADRLSAPATASPVPDAPNDSGQPLPPPGSVAETLTSESTATSTGTNASGAAAPLPETSGAETSGAGTSEAGAPASQASDDRSWWERMTRDAEPADGKRPPASDATPVPATVPAASGSSSAGTSAASAESATATEEPKGGLFDRIRDRFALPDSESEGSLIKITPPEDEVSERR